VVFFGKAVIKKEAEKLNVNYRRPNLVSQLDKPAPLSSPHFPKENGGKVGVGLARDSSKFFLSLSGRNKG
jgi:hypothetical protein